jgi:hypothetical protein
MDQILKINEIFSEHCSYKFINNKYIYIIKDNYVSKINYMNNTTFII